MPKHRQIGADCHVGCGLGVVYDIPDVARKKGPHKTTDGRGEYNVSMGLGVKVLG